MAKTVLDLGNVAGGMIPPQKPPVIKRNRVAEFVNILAAMLTVILLCSAILALWHYIGWF